MTRTVALLGAFILPALVVSLGTQSAYWAGTISSSYFPTYISMLVASSGGAWFFAQQEFPNKTKSALAWATYAPTVLLIIFFAGFYTACVNGDCL